jgi:uncharacterized protein YaiI (UPF0178 family)
VVDASNVIGSRPDGWWRDRPGATRRLLDRLGAFAAETGEPVTVVLDAGPAELTGREDLEVVIARRRGRDAADDEIVEWLREHDEQVTVVTSDATLAGRARGLGAQVEGAGRFRSRIE